MKDEYTEICKNMSAEIPAESFSDDSRRLNSNAAEEAAPGELRNFYVRNEYRQRNGGQRLHMRFAGSAVSEYEKNVILENKCRSFMEMYTVTNGSDLDVYYSMTGYTAVKNYISSRDFSETDILKILLAILELVRSCEDYLIFPEYISLRPEHIFVSQEDGSLKLMYLPGYRTTKSLKKLIATLVTDLASVSSGNSEKKILKNYREQILMSEYGIQGCISLGEDLMRNSCVTRQPDLYSQTDLPRIPAQREEMSLKNPAEARERRSEYFSEKTGGFTGARKKLAELIDGLLF